MTKRVFAYIRVSAKDQNEARQLAAIKAFPDPITTIYIDKQSGKNFDRKEYRRVVRRLKEGDVLVIHDIDRLGRNYDEILEQWRVITKEKGADIVVLNFPLLDTRERYDNDLTGRFVADLVLQILAYVAQKELENIHYRQADGIAEAKARGVRFGRPCAVLPDSFETLCYEWLARKKSLRQAAAECGIPAGTFYSRAKKLQEAEEIKLGRELAV